MGCLIAAGVLILLAILPIGIRLRYDTAGFFVKLLIGPVAVTLFPSEKKRKEKPEKKKENVKSKRTEVATTKKTEEKGGSLTRFQGVISEALAFLGEFRRKLVIERLEMKLTLAGDDPCDLACNYGRAWAALGNLLPLLERVFRIKKRNLWVACDFCAEQTTVFAHLDVVISVGRLLWIVVVYAIRILREYLKLKNLRKGGSKL